MSTPVSPAPDRLPAGVDAADAAPDTFVAVAPWYWATNLGGMAVTGVLAVRSRSRSRRVLFGVAVAVHVGEAVYAYDAARRAGFTRSAPRWALQTLAVGFPSLLALRAATRA